MKKVFYFFCLLLSCSTIKPTVCSTCPTVPENPMPDVVFVTRHDTVDSHVVVDTIDYAHKVIIYPLAGDNWPQLMNAVAYQMRTPGAKVVLAPGDFHMSRPPYAAIIQGGAYRQCTPMIEGMGPARNVPNRFRTNFIADYSDGFGFGVQLNKGAT